MKQYDLSKKSRIKHCKSLDEQENKGSYEVLISELHKKALNVETRKSKDNNVLLQINLDKASAEIRRLKKYVHELDKEISLLIGK